MPEQKPVNSLSESEAANELAELARRLARANSAYFQDDAPEISDAEYDALKQRNASIEAQFPALKREDSPTDSVGVRPAEGFQKITHSVPMLSLGNAFDDSDVRDFDASVRKYLGLPDDAELTYTGEPKIDGLSLALRYESGELAHAATRGDGTTGENVTANALTIGEIPERITGAPDILEVRGEVYINQDDFAALNARQESAGEKVYVNPRNTAAGSNWRMRMIVQPRWRPPVIGVSAPTWNSGSICR